MVENIFSVGNLFGEIVVIKVFPKLTESVGLTNWKLEFYMRGLDIWNY